MTKKDLGEEMHTQPHDGRPNLARKYNGGRSAARSTSAEDFDRTGRQALQHYMS